MAPLPIAEALRLEALLECSILDTPPEPAYDDLARLVNEICQTPIALISLVDRNRQWFKASEGLQLAETPRAMSFCAYAIVEPNHTFVVPDAQDDERFRDNPLVTGDPGIRFYAGSPFLAPHGFPLGTICVVDRQPRQLRPSQLQSLAALARLATELLKLRVQTAEIQEAADERRAIENRFQWLADGSPAFAWSCRPDMTPDWVNIYAERHTGRDARQLIHGGWTDLVHPDDLARVMPTFQQAFRRRQPFACEYRIRRHDGEYRWFLDSTMPTFGPDGRFAGYAGLAVDITDRMTN